MPPNMPIVRKDRTGDGTIIEPQQNAPERILSFMNVNVLEAAISSTGFTQKERISRVIDIIRTGKHSDAIAASKHFDQILNGVVEQTGLITHLRAEGQSADGFKLVAERRVLNSSFPISDLPAIVEERPAERYQSYISGTGDLPEDSPSEDYDGSETSSIAYPMPQIPESPGRMDPP